MTAGASSEGIPDMMLAASFEAATRDDWLRLVDKAIKGADFDKKLVSYTVDGLRIEPVYTRARTSASEPAPPGVAPFTRGTKATAGEPAWEIHQTVGAADPTTANAAVIEELEGGATGVVLEIEAPGQCGVRIATADDMVRTLHGVDLGLAAVTLDAGLGAAPAARHFIAALPRVGAKQESARGFLNLDPIGAMARWGTLTAPVEEQLAEAMALAKEARAKAPGLRTLRVAGTIYHEAGASEGQELACLAATLVAYLRMFEAAGVAPGEAMAHVSFALAADTDQFLTGAKMRAARRLVRRIAEASGAGKAAAGMHITAVSSGRMMARRDPWTNMLRTTIACAGAGLGGADAITLRPFTWALGQPDAFARRIARNIQIVLQEESALGRVRDPAGGAWYVEKLTQDLAAKAWSLFQAIEARDGIIAALGSGAVQGDIATTAKARADAIASGGSDLTGVSAFPLLGDDGVKTVPYPAPPAIEGKEVVRPLLPRRSTAPFEELRDRADAYAARTGKPPQVFLASLGEIIDHTARSTWISNYLAGGGSAAPARDGYRDAADAAAAFKRSGATMACLSSSDALYAAHAMATARALKAAGADYVLMAGRPGDREAALKSAGVDQFVFTGQNMIATLKGLQERLGV